MKVFPFKISKPKDVVLIYQEDVGKNFYNKLHQHEEIQLSYILKGQGTLIVGNTINTYKQGDTIVIGGNLPHVFKSDTSTGKTSKMLSLFFTKDSLGENFFTLSEFQILKPFFNRMVRGFKIDTNTSDIEALFLQLKTSKKLERFIILLQLIRAASTKNHKKLSSFVYETNYSLADGNRLQVVYDYTISNFRSYISLDQIADVSNMTKTSFCKYFKKRTNKTYFEFLNELRIQHACKLLREDIDQSITAVAYDSGFKNIANFNRQFKYIKGMTPSNYRELV